MQEAAIYAYSVHLPLILRIILGVGAAVCLVAAGFNITKGW